MAGLDPAIHEKELVDPRAKPGMTIGEVASQTSRCGLLSGILAADERGLTRESA